MPTIRLTNAPLPPYPTRVGHLLTDGRTIPVTVERTPAGIRVSVRAEGTLGRRLRYLSGCFGKPGLLDKLIEKRMVML